MIKILISEDIDIIGKNIEKIVSSISKTEIIGITKTLEETEYVIEKLKPDVVITDIKKNKNREIFEIIDSYKSKNKSLKFIFITGFNIEYINYKISKYKLDNIIGYVQKPFSDQATKRYIETVIKEEYMQ